MIIIQMINQHILNILMNNYTNFTISFNINPININIEDIMDDGNCLYWSLSLFLFGTEDLHEQVVMKFMKKL